MIHTNQPSLNVGFSITADPAAIEKAASLLCNGGVVAFPTETVYGLGADAENDEAVARIFAIKGRPADNPLIVHLADPVQMYQWASEIPAAAFTLAEWFWPGPLTLILHRQAGVSDLITGSQDTIGLRIPEHPVALSMLRSFGGGVAAPSANRFGRISPTSAAHVLQELGDNVDLILEGGGCRIGLESTILDLTGERPAILRPGAISADQLSEALGETLGPFAAADKLIRVPGMLKSHYAPDSPLQLVSPTELSDVISIHVKGGSSIAIMTCFALHNFDLPGCRVIRMPTDPTDYGRNLYSTLRMLDESAPDLILAETPPETPPWLAVNDRLQRAACCKHSTEKTVNQKRETTTNEH